MKATPLAIIFALAILLSTYGCRAALSPWPDATVLSGQTGSQVKQGSLFAVQVATISRLDLKWTETHDTQKLSLVDTVEDTGPKGAQGGPGRMWFLFKALETGNTTVTLTYKGPGPLASTPAEVVVYSIDIY